MQVATLSAGRQRNAPQTSLQLVAWHRYDFKFDLFNFDFNVSYSSC